MTLRFGLILAAALLLSACGSGASAGSAQTSVPAVAPGPGPCGAAKTRPALYDHVVWVVMENHSFAQIIGSPAAPYVNQLAAQCGLATNYKAVSHPSLPNYIAMTSGDAQGIHDDLPPSVHPLAVPSIFSLVGSGGWRALEESMPANCGQTDTGRYAVRHDPAAYYRSVRGQCRRQDVPLRQTPNLAARFTFVTPNVCNDTHDCPVQTGDTWLKGFLPKVFASRQYRAGRTALFLTWDEDDDSSGNHVATVVIAPSVPEATRSRAAFAHYSLLRTTEELLGLRPLLGRAASATSMRSAFHL